jgi:hypothetical protein
MKIIFSLVSKALMILFVLIAIPAFPQVIPFAFLKQGPVLNWDFTTSPALPSQLTFTRGSTATYFDSSGVMQIAATNAPRFDYDMTTHTANGLLMEAASTNLLICSANIDLASCWSRGGTVMSVSLNSVVAPDGTTTADRLTTSTTSYAYPIPDPTTTINKIYTFSIYAKSTAAGTATIFLQEDGGSYTWYSQTNINVTTSWQRFAVSGARTTTNPLRPVIMLDKPGGDVGTLDVWGAQVELGPLATSYIPTTNATVTRSADSASFNTLSWLNSAVGTLFAEYINLGTESAANYRVFGLHLTNVAGTFAQNSIDISDNNTTVTSNVTVGNVAQFNPGGSLNAAGTINRQAITYNTNNFTSSINRGAVTTVSSGTLPSPAYGYIGTQPGGTMRNRYIRKIRYYNQQVRPAELQQY